MTSLIPRPCVESQVAECGRDIKSIGVVETFIYKPPFKGPIKIAAG